MILTSLLLAGGRRVQVCSETTIRGLSSGPADLSGRTNVMILAPTSQSLPTEGGGGCAGGGMAAVGAETEAVEAGAAEAATEGTVRSHSAKPGRSQPSWPHELGQAEIIVLAAKPSPAHFRDGRASPAAAWHPMP